MTKTRRLIGFDLETFLSPKHGKATLRGTQQPVCYAFHEPATETTELLLGEEGARRLLCLLRDPDVDLVAHNGAKFDLPCFVSDCQSRGIPGSLEAVFAALGSHRVKDTMLAAMLGNLRRGGTQAGPVDLAGCARRFLGVDVVGKHGPDSWRKRYNELDGVPVEHWPAAARDYASLDAVYCAQIWEAMHSGGRPLYTADLPLQTCAAFSLALAKAWGVAVDGEWAGMLWDHFEATRDELAHDLRRLGIMRDDGTVDTKAKQAVFEAAWLDRLGRVPDEHRTTKTREIATNKEATTALEDLYPSTEDMPEAFGVLTKYNRARTAMATWIEPFLDAAEAGHSLHPNVTTLLNTGRISMSAPNLQNVPGRLRGDDFDRRAVDPECIVPMQIRGCVVPRTGCRLVACDYSALEMSTLAQCCANLAGEVTPLGAAINDGMDLHSFVAAHLLNITYEEAIDRKKAEDPDFKRWRALAKIMNFSAPTGASLDGFVVQARVTAGLRITVEEARIALDAWQRAWPEMPSIYYPWIDACRQFDGTYNLVQHGPGGIGQWNKAGLPWRTRLCDKLTVARNSPFQGLASDLMKYAQYLVTKACYIEPESPLYGSRVPLCIHDELVIEAPADRVEEARMELERLMVLGGEAFCPDVAIRVESHVLEGRWEKV